MNRRGRSIERRALSPLLIMMAAQIFQELEKVPVKPLVTIALLGCNIIPHLYNINIFQFNLSNVQQNCLNPRAIVNSFVSSRNSSLMLNRIVFSAFMHADDVHLYYNMLSLCWKGINLERELGSRWFLQLVVSSLLCSHCLMVLISFILNEYGIDPSISGYNSCAIGFSAVLFSLKYVWNQMSPEMTNIMGILNVPSKYAAWFELVIISLISPNVSFLGHLCGILAGIIYLSLSEYRVLITSGLFGRRSSGQRYTYASGISGRNHPANDAEPSTQQASAQRQANYNPNLRSPSDEDVLLQRINRLANQNKRSMNYKKD